MLPERLGLNVTSGVKVTDKVLPELLSPKTFELVVTVVESVGKSAR